MEQNAFAKLEGRDFEYFMNKRRIAIGRDSKLGSVDINMGSTRFVSRKHLEISFEGTRFYLLCRGKNGIFVDDIFQRREAKRVQLPFSCIIRFPSTSIKLGFTSLMEDNGYHGDVRLSSPLPPSSAFQSPYVTPLPSPTGTISVVNSCPASPRGHHAPPSNRIPSINLMAEYATKLLTQQQQKERLVSDSELANVGIPHEEEEREVVLPQQNDRLGSSGDSSPVNTPPNEEEGNGELLGGEDNNNNNTTSNTNNSTTTNTGGETSSMPTEERIGKDGKKYIKPPFSYAQLIVQALLASSDRRQTLSNIYQFISDKYPYYRLEDKGWKNSIRHNLSLNQYFMKAPREREGLGFGKGGYWCMHPDYEERLTGQAYVKRKKKGIPVFPSAGLMSRSAPPSPTHHHFTSSDLNIKDHESSFGMRPSTAGHHPHTPFSLSPFLSRLPHQSVASHSLPASPSRLPHVGHFPPPMRYYPLGIQSPSTDALALESRQRIREGATDMMPHSKRPCLTTSNDIENLNKTRHIGPVIVGGVNPSLLATGGTQPGAVFGIPQRYPFVGMPLLAQTPLSFVPQQQPIVERKEEEEREQEMERQEEEDETEEEEQQ